MIRMLADYDFSFDICIRHHQMSAIIELVRQCPQVQFVLDRLGKPNIRDGLYDSWATDLTRLAALPNVWGKLSGLLTEADPQHWQPTDLAPYMQLALNLFGPERLLFGGDWPAMLLSYWHVI